MNRNLALSIFAISRCLGAMEQWERCLRVLTHPVATSQEVDSALDCVVVLFHASGGCPGLVVAPLREAISEQKAMSSDTALSDKCDEALAVLRQVPARTVKRKRVGDSVVPAHTRKGDHGCRALAAWHSFAAPRSASLDEVSQDATAAAAVAVVGKGDASPEVTAAKAVDAASLAAKSESVAEVEGMILEPEGERVAVSCDMIQMVLERSSDSADGPKRRKKRRGTRSSWVPGGSCTGWVGRGGRAVEPQSQVLIANAYKRVSDLPTSARAPLRKVFPTVGNVQQTSFAARFLSGLLQLPARTIQNIAEHVYKVGPCKRPVVRNWVQVASETEADAAAAAPVPAPEPAAAAEVGVESEADAAAAAPGERPAAGEIVVPPPEPAASAKAVVEAEAGAATAARGAEPAAAGEPAAGGDTTVEATADKAVAAPVGFMNLLRAAAFLSSRGLSKDAFPHLCHLIVASSGDLHSSYHHAKFVTVFDKTVSDIVTAKLIQHLATPLPATGRPPDVEFIGDHVTIGKYFGRARDTFFFMGLQFSIPEWPYTAALLTGIEHEEGDGRCDAQMARITAAFQRLGPQPLAHWVATRFVTACGDGALVRGGPKAKHSGTAVMNALFCPHEDRATWDDFHVYNTAGAKALDASPMAMQYCSLLRKLEHLFGLGQGRHLHRSVTAFLGQPHLRLAAMCGHRTCDWRSCKVVQKNAIRARQ